MTRARGAGRRGFALVYVMMVTLIVSLVLSATLIRQDAQIRLVHRQIRDYQKHHDMLGARDIVKLWLDRTPPRDIAILVNERGPQYSFDIEGVARLDITIADGQGMPIADAQRAPEALRETYQGLLDRLSPTIRPLLRPWGLAFISAATAPAEVLAAVFPDEDAGERFASEILTLRKRGPVTEDVFFATLSAMPGVDAGLVSTVRPLFTFEATLWRLEITLTDDTGETSVFGMVAERGATGGIKVLDWRTEADLRRIAQHRSEHQGRRSAHRRRSSRRNTDGERNL